MPSFVARRSSTHKWLCLCTGILAEETAKAIVECAAGFQVPKWLMSDGPAHFKNEAVQLVPRELKVSRHFTFLLGITGTVKSPHGELMRDF